MYHILFKETRQKGGLLGEGKLALEAIQASHLPNQVIHIAPILLFGRYSTSSI